MWIKRKGLEIKNDISTSFSKRSGRRFYFAKKGVMNMLRLIKHYNKTRNSLYESQLSEDMQSIENALNDHDYNLKRHESSRAAHTSEQIDHGGFTVGNRLKIYQHALPT